MAVPDVGVEGVEDCEALLISQVLAAAVGPRADALLRGDVVDEPRMWLVEESNFPLGSSGVLDDLDPLQGLARSDALSDRVLAD
jgi:hypothetical protein